MDLNAETQKIMNSLNESEYSTDHVSSHRDVGIQIIPGRKYKEEIW